MNWQNQGHPELNFEGEGPLDLLKYHLFKDLEPHIIQFYKDFEAAHPHTYDFFKFFAEEAYDHGVKRFSADDIFQRIRWHIDIEIGEAHGQEYEINDHLKSCYARILTIRENKFMGMFVFKPKRKRRQ